MKVKNRFKTMSICRVDGLVFCLPPSGFRPPDRGSPVADH